MSNILSKACVALASVLMVGLLLAVPAVSAEGAQAPHWSKGDSWAMGESRTFDKGDMDSLWNEVNGSLGMGFSSFNMSAAARVCMLVSVTDATSSEYKIDGKLGANASADADMAMTQNLPLPGTYDLNAVKPTAPRTISMSFALDAAMLLEIKATLENNSTALKSFTLDLSADARMALDIKNLPDVKLNGLQSVTISYKDYHATMALSFDCSLLFSFSPSLDLFDFPIISGEEWNVTSNMTVSGTYGGSLNVQGLPSELEDAIFNSTFLKAAGITSFPIDLSKVISSDDPPVHNGTVGPFTEQISTRMHCLGHETKVVPFYGSIDVYEIEMNNSQEHLFYSDDVHFLTSANLATGDMQLPVDLGTGMQMEPMSPQQAERQISEITAMQADISGESSSSNPLSNPLLIGAIIAVAAVVILVCAFVLLRRKKP